MIDPRAFLGGSVLVQGGTGRVGAAHVRLMRASGTSIAGIVSPAMRVAEVDTVPVFPDCRAAVAATGARTSVLFVAAPLLPGAMREALAAGVTYLVTPTEGMPVHDALLAAAAVEAAGGAWIGASTPGMAVPGHGKLGFLPDASLRPGPLGIMSKSGTLSYEAAYRLAGRGIGQSAWVGVGGDPVKGTRFAELLPFFAADPATRAVLVIGEIGGDEEEELAARLRAARFAKPVYAIIAGATAPEGTTMGHAGAMIDGQAGTFASKQAALREAGAEVFTSLAELETKMGNVSW
jgi:succinyl-CoA synthetase alpha subunit